MDGINIKGVQKTSMIDYPGNIVSTVFLSRCNFRCPFCHNPELVFDEVKDDVDVGEFLSYLESKKGWLDGICITGGEPTLHLGLKGFMQKVKQLGMKIKLDTNGTAPEIMKELIEENLVDYIAMDIKASLENYETVVNVAVDKDKIMQSIKLLKLGKVDYEFRTTAVPDLFDNEEAHSIGKMVKGAKKYSLQQFRNSDKVLDKSYQDKEPYLAPELQRFAKIIEDYVENVEIRGID